MRRPVAARPTGAIPASPGGNEVRPASCANEQSRWEVAPLQLVPLEWHSPRVESSGCNQHASPVGPVRLTPPVPWGRALAAPALAMRDTSARTVRTLQDVAAHEVVRPATLGSWNRETGRSPGRRRAQRPGSPGSASHDSERAQTRSKACRRDAEFAGQLEWVDGGVAARRLRRASASATKSSVLRAVSDAHHAYESHPKQLELAAGSLPQRRTRRRPRFGRRGGKSGFIPIASARELERLGMKLDLMTPPLPRLTL